MRMKESTLMEEKYLSYAEGLLKFSTCQPEYINANNVKREVAIILEKFGKGHTFRSACECDDFICHHMYSDELYSLTHLLGGMSRSTFQPNEKNHIFFKYAEEYHILMLERITIFLSIFLLHRNKL